MFKFKKSKIKTKFKKGDKVIILTRPYDELKGRTAIINKVYRQHSDSKCTYSISIEVLPSKYILNQSDIPRIFYEDELDFLDDQLKRNWILNQLFK